MDRVRFGRALGQGAREAAKALVKAADAAAAPNPAARRAGHTMAQKVVETHASVKTTTAGVKRGGKRFGEAMWGPFVKLSGVLWLEFTGVFFGLFALTAAIGVWKSRADFHAGGVPEHKFWFAVGMLLVFGYFAVSSFMRASRRGRR